MQVRNRDDLFDGLAMKSRNEGAKTKVKGVVPRRVGLGRSGRVLAKWAWRPPNNASVVLCASLFRVFFFVCFAIVLCFVDQGREEGWGEGLGAEGIFFN